MSLASAAIPFVDLRLVQQAPGVGAGDGSPADTAERPVRVHQKPRAYGDAGAVMTDDPALAERVRRLRHHGQSARYRHEERGQSSRLDELQPAILRVKLVHLDEHNRARRKLAARFTETLEGVAPPNVGRTASAVAAVVAAVGECARQLGTKAE